MTYREPVDVKTPVNKTTTERIEEAYQRGREDDETLSVDNDGAVEWARYYGNAVAWRHCSGCNRNGPKTAIALPDAPVLIECDCGAMWTAEDE